jgi:hypothetical protein
MRDGVAPRTRSRISALHYGFVINEEIKSSYSNSYRDQDPPLAGILRELARERARLSRKRLRLRTESSNLTDVGQRPARGHVLAQHLFEGVSDLQHAAVTPVRANYLDAEW